MKEYKDIKEIQLAKSLLEELPNQFISYMKDNNIGLKSII